MANNAKKTTVLKATAKKAKVFTILDTWCKTEEERKSESLHLNFKMLQAKGNEDLIKMQINTNEAKAHLEASMQSAIKYPDFATIAAADLAVEAAELKLERAKETFVRLFGVMPTI